jgi:type IV secretion system protein VirD4
VAEQRPYRPPYTSLADLRRIKTLAGSAIALAFLTANWVATQHAAAALGHSPYLGSAFIRIPRLGRLYVPWDWIIWAATWHSIPQLWPIWVSCLRTAVYPMALIAPVGIAVIAVARGDAFGRRADLHGSARWAISRDLRRAGLLPQCKIIERLSSRLRAIKPVSSRNDNAGIYLARWKGGSRVRFLRDTGPGHVLVFAPTRSGKGAGVVIPTLLTWPHSALIHDLKGENWALTAGWRKRAGHVCLKFDPTDTTGTSVKYNPLEQVRLRTDHEAEDVQNIVHMIVDPDGRGLNDHWVKTGAALLTGTILHVLYAEPNKTLRGVAGVLSDPEASMPETIQRMLSTEHDPDSSMGWRSYRGEPIRTHPIVAESMRELLNKSENERSGVFSTAMSFLSLYRDPVVAANTERSEFRISDLMNHERPVSLYLVVPLSSRDRLRPLMRLILNQIVRTLTTTMNYSNGKATADYKHPLLLMLDEFPALGRLEVFSDALALIAGYGLRACLIAQDLSQIHAAYGHDEAITSNCHTRVAFTPNRVETARLLSQMAGEATVKHSQRTFSNSGTSISEPEISRPLLTTDEAMRLPEEAALVFSTGLPTAWASKLRYYENPEFARRAQIPPPATSDRLRQDQAPANAPEANRIHETVPPAATHKNGSSDSAQHFPDSVRLL